MIETDLPAVVRRLREIAAQVRAWENRDLHETKGTSRPAYFADLEEIADMFEGTHPRFRVLVSPKGSWPRTVQNLIRDFGIAEHMHECRNSPGYEYETALQSAMKRYGVTEKTAAAADTLFRKVMESGVDRNTFLLGKILVASRRAKMIEIPSKKQG